MAYQSEIEKLEARFREKPEQWFAALADAYRKTGDVEMALEVLHAWIEKRPNYSSGHIVLGRCLLEQGKLADAQAAFDRVLSIDMENIIALKSMAEISEKRGDAEGATGWLNKLLEADPMSDEARHALERIGRGELHLAPEATGTTGEGEAGGTGEPEQAAQAVEAEVPAEPAVAEAPAEDLAAMAELDTVSFEASTPPADLQAPAPVLTEEQAAAAETPGDATVADLEPAEFTGAADAAPAPLEGLEPTEFEDTVVEMEPVRLEKTVAEMPETPMPAELLPTGADAEATLVDEPVGDLPLVEPPAQPAAARAPAPSAIQDEVTFVEQSVAEVDEEPAEQPAVAAEQEPHVELPIILPEEVEPDLDEPVLDEPTVREPAPVVTETMAELYVSQGLYGEAVDIYEQLLARRPGDVKFETRLAAVREMAEGETVKAPPSKAPASSRDRYAAEMTGGVSVRQLFADIALGPVAGAAPAAAVAEAEAPAEPQEAAGTGDFSLDQYFGSDGETGTAEAPAPDEGDAGSRGQSGDFQDWLKGLKS